MADEAGHVTYELDAENRLAAWNEAFSRFGEAQGLDPGLARVGAELEEIVGGADALRLHRWLLWVARDRREPLRYRYRCDSPGIYRLLEMTMAARPDRSVTMGSSVVEVRDLRGDDLGVPLPLPICAWCDRVSAAGEWVELDAAVLPLESGDPRLGSRLKHGICPACAASVIADELGGTPAGPG